MTVLQVSLVQMQSSPTLAENLGVAADFIRQAKKSGSDLVVLPENVACMARNRQAKFAIANAEVDHEAVRFFANLARELGIWIAAGSIGIKATADKLANRALVFNPLGAIVGRYDKIHLYDADPKPGESYRESDDFLPGSKAALCETPWGKMGLSICYDVRFAALYRRLAKAGASMIIVPSAFTKTTGLEHWHVLLRARAIETGCYILAPAQCGVHDGGRETFGHSMIVNPSGRIICEAQEEPCIVSAKIDLSKVTLARKALPSLSHDRDFEGP